MLDPITAICLNDLPGIRHGFFTRVGGGSQGMLAGLNCGFGSQDDRERVRINRSLVANHLGAAEHALITPHQIHSADVVAVTAPWSHDQRPKADGLVTSTKGIALGVLTADCGPVLFADSIAGVIGAAHAGWRGAVFGVLDATLAAMEQLGARRARIRAVVGPCIGGACYEVGPEFESAVLAEDPASAPFFLRTTSHERPRFDLPAYVAQRLQSAGTGHIERQSPCTYSGEKLFYSYRRSQHRREPDYGRQISAIMLT